MPRWWPPSTRRAAVPPRIWLGRWSSRRDAAAALGHDEVIRRYRTSGPDALREIAHVADDAVIAHPVLGSVTLAALGDVAVMEATVHLLDLVDAVGGEPPAADALARTRDILAAVPDPAAFIEAATGRSPEPVLPVIR